MTNPNNGATAEGFSDAVKKKPHYNDGIDLSGFDYQNLQGESFTKLIELMYGTLRDPDDTQEFKSPRDGGLLMSKKYLFEVYRAEPIRKKVYPKLPNSPWYIAGLRLVKDKPVRETISEWRYCRDWFGQLEQNFTNKNGSFTLVHLLKKI